ncbi:transcriptional regulator GutM [Vagococcus lutrae]|uniref:Transcriptional regulator GutM n=1 Tax=Vagococcus lutrae TaxID=81947 RepID=A0AAF0BIR1_9ENTE|nr:transcriptional regulator GutM [Vagococcus lutrae]MDO5741647.1 transcriptional regulator GutM [Vagococcus sp.]MDT2801535.1 transcriptional regulator GutM [Vagococcus lutrae]MDT2813085.1 transcriptional regulator GutM [Vagococcus lutrae]MDT2816696.1 transcriptional regulator GutM [Vagococcus lutrae]QZN88310.1 transcriptional regulator GutM [Vagococcus lutrae]
MPFIYVFGIVAVSAYLLQGFLGFLQIKHFTKVYGEMRRKGRVAIGRKSGKFKAGTIVMIAIDEAANILEVKKIQGTTVLAKFKDIKGLEGMSITELTPTLPILAKENKLTQATVMDAVQTYQKVMNGEVIETPPTPMMSMRNQAMMMKYSLQNKFKRS